MLGGRVEIRTIAFCVYGWDVVAAIHVKVHHRLPFELSGGGLLRKGCWGVRDPREGREFIDYFLCEVWIWILRVPRDRTCSCECSEQGYESTRDGLWFLHIAHRRIARSQQ